MQRICLFLSLALMLALAAAAPLRAQNCPWSDTQRCFLPIDLGQGPVLDAGEPTPYTFSLAINPAWGTADGGSFRIGPSVALLYTNPEWEVGGGARLSLRLFRFGLDHWGLFLSGEQLWTTEGGRPASAALVMNAGVVRVGAGYTRDWERDRNWAQLTMGTDLLVLLPLLFPRPDPEPVFGARLPRTWR